MISDVDCFVELVILGKDFKSEHSRFVVVLWNPIMMLFDVIVVHIVPLI